MRGAGIAVLSLVLLGGSVGCVENAILEVELDLPPRPPGGGGSGCPATPCTDGFACVSGQCTPLAFVLIQPRRAAENPFEDEWRGDDLDPIELDNERYVDMVSLVTTEVETDVNLKVRFCTTPNCTALVDADAPEEWFELEHPFYVGARTFWKTRIESIPTASDTTPEMVERCQIRGCVDGDLSSYCRVDGRHLCE